MNGLRKYLFILILLFISGFLFSQKTLMLEKTGTPRHYFFHVNDHMKIKLKSQDTILKGTLWSLKDTAIEILGLRSHTTPLADIQFVYRQSKFVKYFGMKMAEAGLVYFCIVTFNHLINNQQVLTNDVWIVPAAFFATSAITFSFYQKRYRIGLHWKLKILDIPVIK